MSYKIKILNDNQYSELVAENPTFPFNESIRLYLTTILPGLFYSVTNKIKNIKDEQFLFIPDSLLHTAYSPDVFDSIVYKEFTLLSTSIPIENKVFIPVAVEDIPIGGILCDLEHTTDEDRFNLLNQFAVSEYFNLIFNINDRLAGGEAIALQILNLMSSERSADAFLRLLPGWLAEYLGGGLVALYYRSGNSFILRKIAGQISAYEEFPAVIGKEEIKSYSEVITERRFFLPMGAVPNYATELKVPPLVKFVLNGSAGPQLEYLFTGIVPNITSYSVALFFERLSEILGGISEKHFSRQPNWHRLFSALDELNDAGRSRQELVEAIFPLLAEQVNINHISLIKYYGMENRLEIEGVVNSNKTCNLPIKTTFPIGGTGLETLIESGKYYFKESLVSSMSNKLEYQLFKEGVRSYLLVPIEYDNNICGMLGVGSIMTDTYLKEYIDIFETVADYLARLFAAQENKRAIDIHSRQARELNLKLAAMENLRILGELAGGVFHDINNIIGAVLGRCQMMLNHLKDNPISTFTIKIEKDVKLIEQSALDTGEILKRLKELSRMKKNGKKLPILLNEIINDSLELVKPRWERLIQEQGLKIILRKGLNDNPLIMADPSELREVFTNLLLNALDALPKGGEVSISSRQINSKVQVTVSDDGTGIPPEIVETIFEPFFTTKGVQGTGLGLAISKKVINDHGGEIRVKSTVGHGAAFIIELPIYEGGENCSGVADHSPSKNIKANILIVENLPDIQSMLQATLTTYGYRVAVATNGEEAMMQCGREKFDLMIIGFSLPGIGGLELVSQIRNFDKKTRIILTSSWEIDHSISELISKGVDSIITKPFTMEMILETLENLLSSERVTP